MAVALFNALQRGERFPFKHLLRHYDKVDRFLQWWWSMADLEVLLRPYTIVDGDPVLEVTLRGLVDGILGAKHAGDAATVTALESEIDTHVFRLYALTPAEIDQVNGSTTK